MPTIPWICLLSSLALHVLHEVGLDRNKFYVGSSKVEARTKERETVQKKVIALYANSFHAFCPALFDRLRSMVVESVQSKALIDLALTSLLD